MSDLGDLKKLEALRERVKELEALIKKMCHIDELTARNARISALESALRQMSEGKPVRNLDELLTSPAPEHWDDIEDIEVWRKMVNARLNENVIPAPSAPKAEEAMLIKFETKEARENFTTHLLKMRDGKGVVIELVAPSERSV